MNQHAPLMFVFSTVEENRITDVLEFRKELIEKFPGLPEQEYNDLCLIFFNNTELYKRQFHSYKKPKLAVLNPLEVILLKLRNLLRLV